MSNDNLPPDASNVPPKDNALSVVPSGQFEPGKLVRMSFNPQTPDGAVKLVKATLTEIPTLESMANKPMSITDWMRHPAQSVNQETGEVQEFTRIVVFDNNGNAFSCGSMGVDKAISILEMTAGKAPWKPPLKVTVKIRRLANKNNWMILEPDVKSLQDRLTGSK